MSTALTEQLIVSKPCVVRGGGTSTTVHTSRPATLVELTIIADHMPIGCGSRC